MNAIPFLPIGVTWTWTASGASRTLTVHVQPTGFDAFTVFFDPFPDGFPRGFVEACTRGESDRTDYLAVIAEDRAMRDCYARFGKGGGR